MEKKNNLDPQYNKLLEDILTNGIKKQTRNGEVLSVFGRQIKHKMSEGFPLLTGKKMFFKGIVTELLWFLRGDSDVRFLWKNNCSIWDGDWYKHYKTTCSSPYSLEEMKKFALAGDKSFHDSVWDLGPIYGKQWREWTKESFTDILNRKVSYYGNTEAAKEFAYEEYQNSKIDQIQNLINELKTNPDSRRLLVNAWNVGELDQMVLPPCHYGFQVYTRELSYKERYRIWFNSNYETGMEYNEKIIPNFDDSYYEPTPTRAISLMWNQRSVDTFLGLPFNIASYGLLLMMIANEVNMVPDELVGNLGDVHLYSNHIEQAKEQIQRTSFDLPQLVFLDEYHYINDTELVGEIPFNEKINRYRPDFFKVDNYESHPAIKAPLSN